MILQDFTFFFAGHFQIYINFALFEVVPRALFLDISGHLEAGQKKKHENPARHVCLETATYSETCDRRVL
jgi:hypothetical protein